MKTEKQGYDSCSTYEEQLNKYGTIIYTNVGRSMMPLLREHRDIMIRRLRHRKDGLKSMMRCFIKGEIIISCTGYFL